MTKLCFLFYYSMVKLCEEQEINVQNVICLFFYRVQILHCTLYNWHLSKFLIDVFLMVSILNWPIKVQGLWEAEFSSSMFALQQYH